jgi:hypothetical protein
VYPDPAYISTLHLAIIPFNRLFKTQRTLSLNIASGISTRRIFTILSVPLLSAAVLAGPVVVPPNPPEVNPLPFPNPVALYFQLMGAPTCSVRYPAHLHKRTD